DLKNELKNIVLKGDIDQSGSHLIMNARQKTALSNTANFIDYAIKTTKCGESLEFIALDLRNALDALGDIVGNTLTDDILDNIFAEFCLGK
ncbi:MAG: tRNA uridine-5-carboxymethylaminomethyl(34) synthesis GTPase MnmE, partial [Candidatus Anammoxibacter sp.]